MSEHKHIWCEGFIIDDNGELASADFLTCEICGEIIKEIEKTLD